MWPLNPSLVFIIKPSVAHKFLVSHNTYFGWMLFAHANRNKGSLKQTAGYIGHIISSS